MAVAGRCLICAVSSTMFMSRDASDKGGQGAPVECRVSSAGPADLGRRGRTAPRRYPCAVAAASVPIPSASRGTACSRSRGGADGRHHLEAPGAASCARSACRRGAVGSRSGRSSPRRSPHCSAAYADDVAERRARRGSLQVQLEYAFDRLRGDKLAHAYELLVPARARPLEASVRERVHAHGSDLRAGVVGAAAGGAHDCEPDGGADRVGEDARSRGAEGLDLRRRGL